VNLRAKLAWAEAPLVLALVLVGVVSALVIARLGEHSRLILADNYRSVLAAQRMKEALERMDSLALFTLAGHLEPASTALPPEQAFERELRIQEGNLTERGEETLTARLRVSFDDYAAKLRAFAGLSSQQERDRRYFEQLAPAFADTKRLCDDILAVNQDAMVNKSQHVEQRARLFERLLLGAVLLALALGLVASTWLTARLLRPLGIVSGAMRRFGQGEVKARALVQGHDEITLVAAEFNDLADHLERYRSSSLGELLRAQQAAQAAIDGLPDPVLLLDGQGALHGANRAAAELLGIDPDAPGASWPKADPGVQAVTNRLCAHVLGGKGASVPHGFEEGVRVAEAAGGERIFMPRAMPIHGETGAVAGVAVVFQDATRLVRFDELKNNLVATVAHEFRTPLTSLRMALQLCLEDVVGPLTGKQRDLLSAAREDCQRLQGIVEDLLNLSRLESGRIELHRRRVDPRALVAQAIDVHRVAAEQARVTLRAEVLPGLGPVFVDPDRLQIVLRNLLSNAIRYAPAGSEVLVRALGSSSDQGDNEASPASEVRWEVVDQGPGIPAEHQGALFEKFYRVPGTAQSGSGLGLFIAKGLVEAHGGRISLHSEPGQGTTFWFTVPAAPPTSGDT
jgi:NtrC-family two-component system sensor histidine kinase KinB